MEGDDMPKSLKAVGYGAKIFGRRPEPLISLSPPRRIAGSSGSPYAFAYSRTAFKYGLKAAGFSPGDSILVPGFICESALEPFEELDIIPQYYPVDSDLKPMWDKLKVLLNNTTKAFIVVHYFGQPQNIEDCLDFCKRHSLLFIEDNAHGFGGELKGRLLGTFGQIGFSSPRKSFPIRNGAYLYLSENYTLDALDLRLTPDRSYAEKHRFKESLKEAPLIRGCLKQRKMIIEYLKRRGEMPPYGSQDYFRDPPIQADYGMDERYEKYIQEQDLSRIRAIRRQIYDLWCSWAIGKGLTPLFLELQEGSMPLVFPAYTDSPEESLRWYERGHRMGVDIHSWPTLPKAIVNRNREEMRLWERLVCFPIHQEMDMESLKKRMVVL